MGTHLSVFSLLLSLAPLALAVFLYWRMTQELRPVLWASTRMVGQLLLMGYLLVFIFTATHFAWVLGVVLVMLTGASWIALRSLRAFGVSVAPLVMAVSCSATLHLAWVVLVVLRPEPWFKPNVVVPLSGMVMMVVMNAVSLCAERYWAERRGGVQHREAAPTAFRAAMIPQINALLAVGLVSLPGMMTGQILSDVSPLVAVRYQIMIMAMGFGTAAVGTCLFLRWSALCCLPEERSVSTAVPVSGVPPSCAPNLG